MSSSGLRSSARLKPIYAQKEKIKAFAEEARLLEIARIEREAASAAASAASTAASSGVVVSSKTAKELKDEVKKYIPETDIPRWQIGFTTSKLSQGFYITTLYTHIDQLHDIVRATWAKKSRAGTLPASQRVGKISGIEHLLKLEFNSWLTENYASKGSENALLASLNSSDENKLSTLVKTPSFKSSSLLFKDGGGVAGKWLSDRNYSKEEPTYTGPYDSATTTSIQNKTRGFIIFKDPLWGLIKYGYDSGASFRTFDLNMEHFVDTKPKTPLTSPILSCSTPITNELDVKMICGISAAIWALERFNTLFKDSKGNELDTIFTAECTNSLGDLIDIYTNKVAFVSTLKIDEAIVHIIAYHMLSVKPSGFASAVPKVSPKQPAKDRVKEALAKFKQYIETALYSKDFLEPAKLVLGMLRKTLRQYTGDIEKFRDSDLRWELQEAIGRLKSFGDIHYINEACYIASTKNKSAVLSTTDGGAAYLFRHMATLVGVNARAVVNLGEIQNINNDNLKLENLTGAALLNALSIYNDSSLKTIAPEHVPFSKNVSNERRSRYIAGLKDNTNISEEFEVISSTEIEPPPTPTTVNKYASPITSKPPSIEKILADAVSDDILEKKLNAEITTAGITTKKTGSDLFGTTVSGSKRKSTRGNDSHNNSSIHSLEASVAGSEETSGLPLNIRADIYSSVDNPDPIATRTILVGHVPTNGRLRDPNKTQVTKKGDKWVLKYPRRKSRKTRKRRRRN